MQTKNTKPLKVTEDQQKAWDLITGHWGKITSFLGFLITVVFWIGWYANGVSENNELNNLTLKHAQELEDVRKIESENCAESMKFYNELVDKFITANDNGNEK